MNKIGAYKFKISEGMKDQEFELKIVLRKNAEMAAKMGWYRHENQLLSRKNDELNTSVENLAEVFAAVGSAWQSVTVMEDYLQTLIKKKTEMKDQIVLRKYMSHFKTFSNIISSLGEKIKNPGHSDQAASDAKGQLSSFIRNYEIFFKELVDGYFKFNEEYAQALNQFKNKSDTQAFVRTLANKELENRKKVKEFEEFMDCFKGQNKVYESHNHSTLVHGIVRQKEAEICTLKDQLFHLQRRVKILFDYNPSSIDRLLSQQQPECQCTCAGVQLQYMKKQWQLSRKNIQENMKNNKFIDSAKQEDDKKVNEEKYHLLSQQKQSLINRNTILLQKIDQLRLQFKLTNQNVLKSNVFNSLKQQCQSLIDYIADLLLKMKKNQEYILQIEKAWQDEIKALKRKLTNNHIKDKVSNHEPEQHTPKHMYQLFETEAIKEIKQLKECYRMMTDKSSIEEQSLTNIKLTCSQLRKDNDELTRKVNEYQAKQLKKTENMQFKYQRYKQIQTTIPSLIGNQSPEFTKLWDQFIKYVKNREKKIRDIQRKISQKEKQILQKEKIGELMKGELAETEKIFMDNKEKLGKTEGFVEKMKKQLLRLAEENIEKKLEYEQQKKLLSLKLKAQGEARSKLEQKVALVDKFEARVNEIREQQQTIKQKYELWVNQQKQSKAVLQKQNSDYEMKIKLLKDESSEKDKQLSKLQGEKQKLKSEVRQLTDNLQLVKSKSEDNILTIQLEQYKSKVKCSCMRGEKEIVLTECGHMWCRKCIEESAKNRYRICPKCRAKFRESDVLTIQWN